VNMNDRNETSFKKDTFNIDECESYSLSWLIDLAVTCPSYPNITDGCECATANKLFVEDLLTCQSCPQKCSICDTCLSLLGCS